MGSATEASRRSLRHGPRASGTRGSARSGGHDPARARLSRADAGRRRRLAGDYAAWRRSQLRGEDLHGGMGDLRPPGERRAMIKMLAVAATALAIRLLLIFQYPILFRGDSLV